MTTRFLKLIADEIIQPRATIRELHGKAVPRRDNSTTILKTGVKKKIFFFNIFALGSKRHVSILDNHCIINNDRQSQIKQEKI